jgi:hypothetical protein
VASTISAPCGAMVVVVAELDLLCDAAEVSARIGKGRLIR